MTPSTDHPDLVALLRGELDRDDVLAADEHLLGCAACRQELAEVATAHAVLTSAARTGIDHEIGGDGARASMSGPLPPLAPRRRRLPRAVGVSAAAAVGGLVAGAVLVAALDGPSDQSDGEPPTPYVAAALQPLHPGPGAGRVEMIAEPAARSRVTVETDDLPSALGERFYYAWLLDPRTNKMLPLGQIGPSGAATFELDDALLAAYSAVDISLEADDGDPAHSVTSVLRGSYDPAPRAPS